MTAAFIAAALSLGSLYEQSLARLLLDRYRDRDLAYVILNARSGSVIVARWESVDAPAPFGSLVKPFLALAYGEAHGFRFPEIVCAGAASKCWLPGGHGRVGIVKALAHSCNAYFLTIGSAVNAAQVADVARRFSIELPPDDADAKDLIGLGNRWQVSPAAMLRAYAELGRRRSEPGVALLLDGLAAGAATGTGRAIGRGALVKTGTAPCTHDRAAPGDGYVIVLHPSANPRLVLLVRVHGQPGVSAARAAALMLRTIAEGR